MQLASSASQFIMQIYFKMKKKKKKKKKHHLNTFTDHLSVQLICTLRFKLNDSLVCRPYIAEICIIKTVKSGKTD